MKRTHIVLAVALALAAPAGAVMLEASLEELVTSSSVVVKGRVVSLRSRFADPVAKFIVTDVTLRVDEVWAGPVPPSRPLTFTVTGGEVNGLGMRQSHQPVFAMGEETVVFLRATPDARFEVNHAEQGKFSVHGDQAISFKRVLVPLQRLRSEVTRLKPARDR